MTPREVREMTIPEYLAFAEYMARDIRERERQARKQASKRKGRR